MDKFDKLMKGMGAVVGDCKPLLENITAERTPTSVNASASRVGIAKSAREKLYEQLGVRETDIRKAYGDENVSDQHGESWHIDNDKLVHKLATTATETETHDQDTQREAASVVVERPSGKRSPGVYEKSETSAQRLLNEDELFLKAMDEDEEEEEEEPKDPEEEISDEKKRDEQKKDSVVKAGSGAGSRGGKVIGKTKSGKPIYDKHDHPSHAGFTHADHDDAVKIHDGLQFQEQKAGDYSKIRERSNAIYGHMKKQESFKSDRDVLDDLAKACGAEYSEVGDEKKKREAAAKKMESLHENAPSLAEKKPAPEYKSELDEIVDLVKAKPVVTPRIDAHAPVRQHVAPIKKSKSGFSITKGPGGMVFDFGVMTGNPIADNATKLLNENADPTQSQIVKDQRDAQMGAMKEFVSKGEGKYETDHKSEYASAGGAPQEAEVVQKAEQMVADAKKVFVGKSMQVGKEQVQAMSETDAALIDMMKNGGVDFAETGV